MPTELSLPSGPAILLTACFVSWLAGCSQPAARKMPENNARPPLESESKVQSLDPRLLEQTDKQASTADEDRAKAYHRETRYAEVYPVFQRSCLLVQGGYSVRFGTSSNSTQGMRYFFDEQGHLMRMERRFPPY